MKLSVSFLKREIKKQQIPEKTSGNLRESAIIKILHELLEGQEFVFGEPWQLASDSLATVVPILRRSSKNRTYRVIQEIAQDIVTLSDSGRIGQINATIRRIDKPVFVRAGTLFKGQGTQSRTCQVGMILEPGKENPIPAFCVHSSHGISTLSRFSTMPNLTPRTVEDILVSPHKNQAAIWKAANTRGQRTSITHCGKCGSSKLLENYEGELVCLACGSVVPPSSPNDTSTIRNWRARSTCFSMGAKDNVAANLEAISKFNQNVEHVLSKIPADLENQVGLAILDSLGVLGLEMFDHPDSWRAFSRSIVRNYADILARERSQEGIFSLNTERIHEAISDFLRKAENLMETLGFQNRAGETRMLSGDLIGEFTIIGPDVIHLLLKRKANT